MDYLKILFEDKTGKGDVVDGYCLILWQPLSVSPGNDGMIYLGYTYDCAQHGRLVQSLLVVAYISWDAYVEGYPGPG